MTDDEFKSGVKADGSLLMQPEGESPLALHVRKMQDMASRYIEPAPYVDRLGNSHADNSEEEQDAFLSDMVYMLDCPEQREVLPNLHFSG